MSNILITGGNGFVGASLARHLLKKGEDISIFVRKDSDLWRLEDIRSRLKIHTTDMENVNTLQKILRKIKPEIVYHLATYGGYPFQQDIASTIRTNLIFSTNLMSSLENCDSIKKFVNTGSSSEYGPKSKPMKESDSTEPITPYGITKLAQTLFTKYFSYQQKLPTITLRLFSVYGPYEEPGRLIYDVVMAIIKRRTLKLGSPHPKRDFIYMVDLISALEKAAESNLTDGRVLNVGSGREHSVADVVDMMNKLFGHKLNVVWGREEKKRSFDSETRWVADISETRKLLDWKPMYSLKEGLIESFEWYNNH